LVFYRGIFLIKNLKDGYNFDVFLIWKQALVQSRNDWIGAFISLIVGLFLARKAIIKHQEASKFKWKIRFKK
jgi:hypothetical protein